MATSECNEFACLILTKGVTDRTLYRVNCGADLQASLYPPSESWVNVVAGHR